MEYKYFSLKAPSSELIYRLPDGAFIPKDLDNGDYRHYCEWCDKGNKPLADINRPEDAIAIAEKLDSAALTGKT